MNNPLKITRQLGQRFDNQDPFVRGHQILKIRRPKKKIPDWVNNNLTIKKLLLRSFPLMESDFKQRAQAGRWARVITLYFKGQWSRGQIAEELGITYDVANSLIFRICASARGLRTDGQERKRPAR